MELVLLPGMDGTGKLFRPFLEVCSGRVIRYPEKKWTYEQYADFVTQALPSEPFVLLAESFSGPIARRVAMRKPENLKGLVLVSTFFQSPVALISKVPPFFWKLLLSAPDFSMRQALLGTGAPDALARELIDCVRGVDLDVLTSRIDIVAKERMDATRIEIPVLYIRGTRDRLIIKLSAKQVGKHCDRFELVEIKGPHLILQTQPHAAAQAIRKFLAQVE